MQGLLLSILFVVLLSLATQPPVAARNPTPSLKALKNRVVHEGCPVYLGFSQDRYTPDYVAGTIPCAAPDSLSPQDRDRVLFVPPVLTGHWVSEVDNYGNSHTWDINAKFGGLVRNKAYEDWNNQCLQTVEYAHTTTGNRNGSETGMFLLDWKFGMNYDGHKHINEDTRIASTVPNLSLHYVYHDPKTTKVVIVHPAPSGLLPNITLATAATNITSTAGKSLLQALSQLPDPTVKFDFIWEAASGSEMTRSTGPAPAEGTELPISAQDEMSFALAISDDKMWLFAYKLPGYDDGLVTFKREATVPESPQVPTAVEEGCTEIPCPKLSWERKIWDNTITNMQGKWQSEAGDTLSVAMPPHNINSTDAFHAHFMKYLSPGTPKVIQALEQLGTHYIGPHYPGALDIFTLCSHSRIRDFVQVWRNPLSTNDLVVLNYKQNVYVYHPEAKGPGAGVHDELGFFVFDWPNRKITRHGVLPHGSSFEMVSGFPTFSNQPHTDLSAPTMPRFGPKNKFIFRGVNSEEYLSGVQPGVNAEAFQHGRPTVELNDPARLLNEINSETAGDFQGVTTITLHSGNSMDLPFVDKLASRTDKSYTKFVTNITSSFFLSEFGSEEPLLQYIQTVHFNFPVRGTPDIDRSQGRQSTKSAKWPHVIVSSLRRVKEFTGL